MIQDLSPEDYRKRYFELKRRADENAARPRVKNAHERNPDPIAREDIIAEEIIPGGWYWTARVPKGRTLRIVNDEATHGVSAFFWNADDTSERFNAADTVKVQWTTRIAEGRLLLSDMGRVLASVSADTCGAHDCLAGGSTPRSDRAKYGAATPRNTRDNFILAAGLLGLSERDVAPCITFFAPVRTDDGGRFVWHGDALAKGAYVDLHAEMNILVALSNCPHPFSPAPRWEPRPVRAILWRTPPESAAYCRTATDEAARAFENTDAFLAERVP